MSPNPASPIKRTDVNMLSDQDCTLTPEVLAIYRCIRDNAPILMKMTITPKLISALVDCLAAAREEGRQSAGEWRPIDSAPKDGAPILVGHPMAAFTARWDDDAFGWVDGCTDLYGNLTTYAPTHWMPLPDAPQAAPVEQKAMPEPPWEATSLGANNAKREGWKAHFEGRAREACPFPAGRDDLQRGYRIGWDAANEQKDGAS